MEVLEEASRGAKKTLYYGILWTLSVSLQSASI